LNGKTTLDRTHEELFLSLGRLEAAKGNGYFRTINGGFNNASVASHPYNKSDVVTQDVRDAVQASGPHWGIV
jgi:hypothetical protein